MLNSILNLYEQTVKTNNVYGIFDNILKGQMLEMKAKIGRPLYSVNEY